MRAVLFLLAAIPVFAQYSKLATTDDGSQLYFSSPLQLTGSTDMSSDPKIYRYDGTSIQLDAQVVKIPAPPVTIPPGAYSIASNYYSLRVPFVSGDGSVTGYVGYADCTGCVYNRILGAQTTFQSAGASGSLTLPYACDVSTNGRYALCQTRYVLPGAIPSLLFDLSSLQQSTEIAAACWGDPHYMTATGSALTIQGQALALWSAVSGSQGFPIPYSPLTQSCPMISNDGSLIVHNTRAALLIYNVATRTDTVLIANNGTSSVPIVVTISNDARWILVEIYDGLAPQLAMVDSSDGSMKQLTSEPGGIQHGASTLSGDGSTVYVSTVSGALLKIDVQSGVSRQIVAGQPAVASVMGASVPGSLNQIIGTALASAQVTLNGGAVPVVSSTATEIDIQIPWETPVGNATLQVAPATQTPFRQSWPLQIQAYQPAIALNSAIAGDFSGLNSAFSPANPGDVVTFYLTGLGAVTVPVVDGSPAPASPLPWLQNSVTVTFGSTPIQVFYAGLAPGLVGIYQLSVQTPLHVPGNPFLPNRGPVNVGMTIGSFALPGVWMNPNQ